MSLFTYVGYIVSKAWQGFWRNAMMSLAATVTIALMLLLLAGLLISVTSLNATMGYFESKVEVLAYLKDGAEPSKVQALQDKLIANGSASRVDYVSKEEALSRLKEWMIAQGKSDTLADVDSTNNPLPASLEIKLKDPSKSVEVTQALSGEEVVESVQKKEDIIDKLLTITGVMRFGGVAVILIIGIIALFVIMNTIRVAVYSRRDEIEIMKLVGATDWFVRWPFILEGVFCGLLAFIITATILGVAYKPITENLSALLTVLPINLGQYFAIILGTTLFTFGTLVGAIGAMISVHNYLGK